jgi:hypothetical protein
MSDKRIISDISMYLIANGIANVGYGGSNNVLLNLLTNYGFDAQFGQKIIVDTINNLAMTTFFVTVDLNNDQTGAEIELNRDIMNIINVYSDYPSDQFQYTDFMSKETNIVVPTPNPIMDMRLIHEFRPLDADVRDRLIVTVCDIVINHAGTIERNAPNRKAAAWSLVFLAYDTMIRCGINARMCFGNVNSNIKSGYFDDYIWLSVTNSTGKVVILDIIRDIIPIHHVKGYMLYKPIHGRLYTVAAHELRRILFRHVKANDRAIHWNPFNVNDYESIKMKIYAEAVTSVYTPV